MRPKLRADVFLVPQGDRTFVRCGVREFTVPAAWYRMIERLAPHLTGDSTLTELTDHLAEDKRVMVDRFVRQLIGHGLVRDVTGAAAALSGFERSRYEAELAFLEGSCAEPEVAFRRFRDTPLAVIGTGLTPLATVRAALQSGVRTVQVFLDDPADGVLAALESAARKRDPDQQVLVAHALEEIQRSGIALGVGDHARSTAFAARVDAELVAFPVDDAVLIGPTSKIVPTPRATSPSPFLSGPTVGVVAAHVVFACLCAVAGLPDADRVRRLDLRTLEVV